MATEIGCVALAVGMATDEQTQTPMRYVAHFWISLDPRSERSLALLSRNSLMGEAYPLQSNCLVECDSPDQRRCETAWAHSIWASLNKSAG